jgi:spore coat polysaccharide biosynthesis protein SpsF
MPMLARQIERVQRSKLIDSLLVATSSDVSDNPIEQWCRESSVECFRGKLDDVLDRFYKAAKLIAPEQVVRLTGDCPLADPDLIDEVIRFHISGDFDYSTNAIEPTYPDGLDVEVFRFACLEQAWREAKLPSQREHVTPFIHQQPDRFRIGLLKNATDFSYLRWTVDEALDFELVRRIYEALYPIDAEFKTQDILAFLDENAELKTFNISYDRNEGFQKSLLKDKEFLESSMGE